MEHPRGPSSMEHVSVEPVSMEPVGMEHVSMEHVSMEHVSENTRDMGEACFTTGPPPPL
jgi:hypothetical protein